MTNIKMKKTEHNARINDDFSEHLDKLNKLEENGANTHLTKNKPLTLEEFKERANSNLINDEDVIKAVYNALPNVNSNSFYRNGSLYLRVSPMREVVRTLPRRCLVARKYAEDKLLLKDIVREMDRFNNPPDKNFRTPDWVLSYARALAQASICYVTDEYAGKENN